MYPGMSGVSCPLSLHQDIYSLLSYDITALTYAQERGDLYIRKGLGDASTGTTQRPPPPFEKFWPQTETGSD